MGSGSRSSRANRRTAPLRGGTTEGDLLMTPGQQFSSIVAEKHKAREALVEAHYLPAEMEPPYHYERHGQEVSRNYTVEED